MPEVVYLLRAESLGLAQPECKGLSNPARFTFACVRRSVALPLARTRHDESLMQIAGFEFVKSGKHYDQGKKEQ